MNPSNSGRALAPFVAGRAVTAQRETPAGGRAAPFERWFVSAGILLTFVLVRLLAALTGTGEASPLAQAIWGAIYIAAAAGLIASRKDAVELIRRSPLIIILLALAIVSCMWSVDPWITLRRAAGLVGTTAFAYYIVVRLTLDEVIEVFAASIIVSALLSLVAIFFVPTSVS
jgi:exopolysaccharide production protein ExoQ